ncbi:hypothetical protein THAOC_37041, partial [Thalassiosira oceanica]
MALTFQSGWRRTGPDCARPFRAPHVRHGVVGVDRHEVTPVPAPGLGRRESDDLGQEQLGTAVRPRLAEPPRRPLQAPTLAVLFVQVGPRRAEQTEGPVPGPPAAQDLARARVRPVGRARPGPPPPRESP